MQRLWSFLIDARTLAAIGLAALAAFLFLGAAELRIAAAWAGVLLAAVLAAFGIAWLLRRRRERRAAAGLEAALEDQAAQALRAAGQGADAGRRAEIKALRDRMREAVRTLKRSKLGHASGAQALYALPWYLVIGNPAAGKSTAVVRSGLQFPFADAGASGSGQGPAGSDAILQGIGGTRNCDWFFTTEGILLDTAGRYAVHEEDRSEWLGFLGLLKKHRPRAPVNGIVVAASLSELVGARPEFGIELAKQLRQRMQEITEQLEVDAPVYVVFTKADLIAGFAEFFMDRDPAERERAWGATLPYASPAAAGGAPQPSNAALQFDQHFELLYAGLKDGSIAHMAQHRGEQLPPGVLAFPLEFAALKPALRNFIATLFEDNPYQFRPVFRGFYFTSAVQQGESTGRASARVAQRFALGAQADAGAAVYSNAGFFLKDLFSKVIFADRQLVRQRMSPAHRRARLAGFLGGAAALGLVLGLLTWSYVGNQRLLADTRADLEAAGRLQEGRLDLGSRLDALQKLQDRLAQLQGWRDAHPWSVGLGLYQGDQLEAGLRREYFNGLRVVALKPVAESLEAYLQEVNAQSTRLKPAAQAEADAAAAAADTASGAAGATPYAGAQPTDVSDAYNALKTYLMLCDRRRLEAGHAGDQVTRFWRGWLEANRGGMPREELIRKAEGIVSYALTQMAAPDFPQIEPNLGLVDGTRENLRRVVRGMPARERVYAEIKARAATRFAPLTVASITGDAGKGIVAGSTAVSGVYTRAAWNGYVKQAIEDAANKELQAEDWVLKSALRDDLTLEGSPQAIQKALTEQYKQEYVREWKRFMQGVSVAEFGDFDGAIARMNRLGDPTASPLGKLMQALHDETSWDNPSLVNERLAQARGGVVEWFKRTVLGQVPAQVNVNVQLAGAPGELPMGAVGREFAGVGRLMMARDGGSSGAPTQMRQYLDALSRLRTRFNQIKAQGDPGPAARTLMQATLDGGGSELADALRIVDEQMLTGMGDSQKAALRPLLVRPLMQAFAVLVPAAESELNRVWQAQVAQPFGTALAPKYPFDPASRIEAAPAEIGRFFGPEGAIAKYTEQTLSGLTVRRGDVLAPRTWADMGIRLQPAFAIAFAGWVAPVAGAGPAGNGAGGSGPAAGAQTVFQILPLPAPGLTEYTLEIDGQQLRFRNTQAAWTTFAWPNAQGAPGVKISGVAFDGRNVEFLDVPGHYGLERMLGAAQRRKLDAATFELKWANGSLAVPVKLRIVSSAGATAAASGTAGAGGAMAAATLRGLQLPARVAGADAPAAEAVAGGVAGAADALAQAAPAAGAERR